MSPTKGIDLHQTGGEGGGEGGRGQGKGGEEAGLAKICFARQRPGGGASPGNSSGGCRWATYAGPRRISSQPTRLRGPTAAGSVARAWWEGRCLGAMPRCTGPCWRAFACCACVSCASVSAWGYSKEQHQRLSCILSSCAYYHRTSELIRINMCCGLVSFGCGCQLILPMVDFHSTSSAPPSDDPTTSPTRRAP